MIEIILTTPSGHIVLFIYFIGLLVAMYLAGKHDDSQTIGTSIILAFIWPITIVLMLIATIFMLAIRCIDNHWGKTRKRK